MIYISIFSGSAQVYRKVLLSSIVCHLLFLSYYSYRCTFVEVKVIGQLFYYFVNKVFYFGGLLCESLLEIHDKTLVQ